MKKRLIILFLISILSFTFTKGIYADITHEQYKWLSKFSDDELRQMGNLHLFETNEPDSALFYYYFVINRLIDKPDRTEREHKNLIASYNNVGYVYMFYFYDYGKALDCLVKTQELINNDYTPLLLNLGCITCFYAQCFPSDENFRLANDYFTRSFFASVKEENWYFTYLSFANLWISGFSDEIFEMNDSVLHAFEELPVRMDDPDYRASLSLYRAVRFIQNKDYDEALREFRNQLVIGSTTDTPERDYCQTLYLMNEVFYKQNELDSLFYYTMQIDSIADANDLKDFKKDVCESLFRYYSAKGDVAKANAYELSYFKKRDSLLMQHNLNGVRSNYLMHNLKQVNLQVEDLEQKRRMQNIIITITLMGIVITTLLLFFLYKKNNRLRQSNRMLYQKNLDLLKEEDDRRKRLSEESSITEKPKYLGSSMDEETKVFLREKIEENMNNIDEICSFDFSLQKLAELCNSTYKNISQVINESYEKSFIILLSEYRIHEACRRMNDIEHYGHFTIDAIGQGVGFKGRSGFLRAFKRVTGLTPSEYQALAREHKKE